MARPAAAPGLYGVGPVGGHIPAPARVGFHPRIPAERAQRQKAAGSIALQYGADQYRRHAASAAARQPSDLCVSQVGLSERPLGVDNREPNCARYAGRHRRIRVYGIEEYDYADVQIDRNGNLSCNLLKVVPVQPRMDAPTPPNQQPVDPQVWYDVEGREVLERVIADLDSRGHSSLTLKEDGSVCVHEDDDTKDIPQEHLTAFPPKVYWPRLGQVLESEGLSRSEERRVGKECRSRWSPYH